MSAYERYDTVSASYDESRAPIGVEVVADCLALALKPLAEIELLDAGCGTGNFSAALVSRVGRIDAVDLSEGMLGRARAKLAAEAAAGRIAFHQGGIEALPFPDRHFDAVMFNQVLHHLEPGDDPLYQGHARALAEAHRVLRPGGVVVVNACSHEQLTRGFWYYGLIPGARGKVLGRCAPAERIEAILRGLGFMPQDPVVPPDAVMQGPAYLDPRGPLDPAWRAGDSIWALTTDEELGAALAELKGLEAAGALEAYVAEQDAPRAEVGQLTFFSAVKPS